MRYGKDGARVLACSKRLLYGDRTQDCRVSMRSSGVSLKLEPSISTVRDKEGNGTAVSACVSTTVAEICESQNNHYDSD